MPDKITELLEELRRKSDRAVLPDPDVLRHSVDRQIPTSRLAVASAVGAVAAVIGLILVVSNLIAPGAPSPALGGAASDSEIATSPASLAPSEAATKAQDTKAPPASAAPSQAATTTQETKAPGDPVPASALLQPIDIPRQDPGFAWQATEEQPDWPAGGALDPCDEGASPLEEVPSRQRSHVIRQVEASGRPAVAGPAAFVTVLSYATTSDARLQLENLGDTYESCLYRERGHGSGRRYEISRRTPDALVVQSIEIDYGGVEFIRNFIVVSTADNFLAIVQYSVGEDLSPDPDISYALLQAQRNRLCSVAQVECHP